MWCAPCRGVPRSKIWTPGDMWPDTGKRPGPGIDAALCSPSRQFVAPIAPQLVITRASCEPAPPPLSFFPPSRRGARLSPHFLTLYVSASPVRYARLLKDYRLLGTAYSTEALGIVHKPPARAPDRLTRWQHGIRWRGNFAPRVRNSRAVRGCPSGAAKGGGAAGIGVPRLELTPLVG